MTDAQEPGSGRGERPPLDRRRRVRPGCLAAQRAVPRRPAAAGQPVSRAHGDAGAQRPAVPGRAGRGRPGAAAAGELCAGADHPAHRRHRGSAQAAVRRRRPARRPRSGDRRLQGRQRDRRRHARRSPLLLRGLPARAGARADDRGHHGGRGRLPRAGDRAPPRRRRQARGDRQLPGRLGDDDGGRGPARSCSARSSSRAPPCPTGRACMAATRCATPAGSTAAAG